MTKSIEKKQNAKSWRTIHQIGGRQAVTAIARKRRFMAQVKVCGYILILLVTAGGFAYSINFFRSNHNQILLAGPSSPVRRIVFQSDGVLNQDWFEKNIPWLREKEIFEVDIFAIKTLLEMKGQISSANVTRRFPDELIIEVKEREPILRARVPGNKGKIKEVMIARDGVVYFGEYYSRTSYQELPYLGGIRFKKENGHINSLHGMDIVAELLDSARLRYPSIYQSWRVVSCEHFDGLKDFSGEFIKIRSRDIQEIIFTPTDFDRQLDQLARIMKISKQKNANEIKRIDLTMIDQVAVQFIPYSRPGKFRN